MIEKVKWDSNFFKFPVGSFKFKEQMSWDLTKFISESKKYGLVYIFSKTKLEHDSFIKLVDRKVIYCKKLVSKLNCINEIVDFDPNYHNYSDLLALGYLSGTFSRFKLDNNFSDKEFKNLYKVWIDNSISGEIALRVFIKMELNKIAGFVTLKKANLQTSQIGLIAVDPEFQGKNIASDLIRRCELASLSYGFSQLEVATQYDNIAARNLYEKNDFELKTMEYIYHVWNK